MTVLQNEEKKTEFKIARTLVSYKKGASHLKKGPILGRNYITYNFLTMNILYLLGTFKEPSCYQTYFIYKEIHEIFKQSNRSNKLIIVSNLTNLTI